MSHFAKVKDGKVINLIVAEQDFIDNLVETEPGRWIQTSYNTHGGVHYDPITREPSADQTKALRYNYGGIGFNYNETDDAFYEDQPFPSWTLNTTTYLWEAPITQPDGAYYWDEDVYNADTSDPKTDGWVAVSDDE